MKKHEMIRLVVTDLDGTLLEPDHSISERAISAIKTWKQSGGHEKEFLEMGELLEPLKNLYTVTVYRDQGCEIVPGGCNKASGYRNLLPIWGSPWIRSWPLAII